MRNMVRDGCLQQKKRAKLWPGPLSLDFGYWQPATLKVAIRVCQLKVPEVRRYWLVYQKVQSSTGSTVMAL